VVYYFSGSYIRFSKYYVDENTTIRFSEKISPIIPNDSFSLSTVYCGLSKTNIAIYDLWGVKIYHISSNYIICSKNLNNVLLNHTFRPLRTYLFRCSLALFVIKTLFTVLFSSLWPQSFIFYFGISICCDISEVSGIFFHGKYSLL
jgi:hypothetical protein